MTLAPKKNDKTTSIKTGENEAKQTGIGKLPSVRLLMLDGKTGTVTCRVHGPLSTCTVPRLSRFNTLECITRSFLRMKNLIAVRGKAGAGMIGPADYFCNLESPHQFQYTINVDSRPVPDIKAHPLKPLKTGFDSKLETVQGTRIVGKWVSGRDHQHSKNIKLGASLFPDSGTLNVDTKMAVISLGRFDACTVDLSRFKARLVRNDVPFSITSRPLPITDEYRVVSYYYEPGYAAQQMSASGGGLFLERHPFSQIITPLDGSCTGFVTLAQAVKSNEYELVAVCIPLGWTLIVQDDCIHGDATLSGAFLMGMTSNHVTMSRANTVFLKHTASSSNIQLVLNDTYDMKATKTTRSSSPVDQPDGAGMSQEAAKPLVLWNTDDKARRERFARQTQGISLVFNPISRGYWQQLPFWLHQIALDVQMPLDLWKQSFDRGSIARKIQETLHL